MIIRAIYEDGVLKPLKKLDLPERAEVSVIIIMGSFSKLIEELGKNAVVFTDDEGMHFHAKEVDVDSVLMREINFKGIEDLF